MPQEAKLKRVISLPVLSFYGIGTIIGAGIYVLIGKVGAAAGVYMPLSFLLAGVIACFTGLSYAELSARYPKSAGTVLYVLEAWQKPTVAQIIGVMVALTGIVSAGTIASGFVGYLSVFIDAPSYVVIPLLLFILMLVAMWGIEQSALTIMMITLVEIGGLIFAVYASSQAPIVHAVSDILVIPTASQGTGILIGSFLAFYAFIGFEDMVNVAEEVKNPRFTLPRAIILAIAVSVILYMAVAFMAVRVSSIAALAESKAPLADMVRAGGFDPKFITIISLFAVINGALVQMIMASRLMYGMAQRKLIPDLFSYVNKFTQTPVIATFFVTVLIVIFALWLPLVVLAKVTSLIMLLVFSVVNLSLLTIKWRERVGTRQAAQIPDGAALEQVTSYPIMIPFIGLILSLFLILLQFI